jgi:toxin ParE1/3/4
MKVFEVRYSDGSEQDLRELATYILEQSSEQRAVEFTSRLVIECDSLAKAPHRGIKRTDLRPNMRVVGYKRTVSIVFRIEEEKNTVVVLGFSYGGRSVDHILARNE